MELTRRFTAEQFSTGLDSWDWIGLGGKTPLFTSPFGDVVLRSGDDFWWLDLLEGTLTRPWQGEEAIRAALATSEGQDRYLLAGLAYGAERRGLVPGADQVYGFRVPPVLGGPIDVDHIEVIDFVVSVNLAGQLHRQVKDLPPGTRISGFTFNEDS